MPAVAQPIQPWSAEFERPLCSSIDLATGELFANTCGLNEEQAAAGRDLLRAHSDHFAAFASEAAEIRKSQDRAVQQAASNTMARLQLEFTREETLSAIADRQAALDEKLIAALRGMLTEEQAPCWDCFIMRFNRHRWSNSLSMYADEHIDLLQLLDEAVNDGGGETLDPNLDASMRAYVRRINTALLKLADVEIRSARRYYRDNADRWHNDGSRYWMGESTDMDAERRRKQQMETRLRTHKELRDANRESLALLESLVPDTLKRSLHAEYQRLWLKLIPGWRVPAGKAWVEKVLLSEGLKAEQRRDIQSLADQFELDRDVAETRILHASDKVAESNFQPLPAAEKSRLTENLSESVQARFDKESQLVETVWALLDEQQQAQLKKPLKDLPVMNTPE